MTGGGLGYCRLPGVAGFPSLVVLVGVPALRFQDFGIVLGYYSQASLTFPAARRLTSRRLPEQREPKQQISIIRATAALNLKDFAPVLFFV